MTTMFQHKFAHTNGIRMHYVEFGEGPLVLLCHGWPESWYSWRHQIQALADAGYRVVVPDQRGYGQTDAPQDVHAYSIFNLTADLVGLVQALGEEKAILVGHDWGSMVASTAALFRPDVFRAVALLSVPFIPRRSVRPLAAFHMATQERHFYQDYFQELGRVEHELEQDVHRAVLSIFYTGSGDCRLHPEHKKAGFLAFDKSQRFIDALALPDKLPEWLPADDVRYLVEQFSHAGFRGGINWYRNMDRNWELTPFLAGAKLTQPCIFITGELDGVRTMTKAEFESFELNAPRLFGKYVIERAGHWIQQEKPQEVNELLLSFLLTVNYAEMEPD